MQLNPEIKAHLSATAHPIIFEFGACNGDDVHRLNEIMGEKGMIYAWEANPVIVEFLKTEKPLPPNAVLVECAVSDVDGTSPFNVAENTQNPCCGSSSLLKPIYSPHRPKSITFTETIDVPTRSLDNFCEEHGVRDIDLVLADIQGAEPLMIRGGQQALRRTRYLSIELNHKGDYRYEGMLLGIDNIMKLLPKGWEKIGRIGPDVLFKNCPYTDC